MKTVIVGLLMVVLFIGFTEAKDKNGGWVGRGGDTCTVYLDAYSRSTLKGESGYKGPYIAWNTFGWLNGFFSGYNLAKPNNIEDVIEAMTNNDVRRWVASWCRDNPSSSVDDAVVALLNKILK